MAAGSIPPCGPLLHVIPSLSPHFLSSLQLLFNKGQKSPKNILKKNRDETHFYIKTTKNKVSDLEKLDSF